MIRYVASRLWRGPRPVDLEELKNIGITAILSLQYGWMEVFSGKLYAEDELARTSDIDLIHVRLSDFFAPSEAQVIQCFEAIAAAQARGPVYIHCKHGVDRTGFICAAYRVLMNNWSVDRAVEEWKLIGFHGWFYFWWESAFRKLMAKMQRATK